MTRGYYSRKLLCLSNKFIIYLAGKVQFCRSLLLSLGIIEMEKILEIEVNLTLNGRKALSMDVRVWHRNEALPPPGIKPSRIPSCGVAQYNLEIPLKSAQLSTQLWIRLLPEQFQLVATHHDTILCSDKYFGHKVVKSSITAHTCRQTTLDVSDTKDRSYCSGRISRPHTKTTCCL